MKNISALFVAGMLAADAAFAAEVDLSKLPPPAAKQGVTFETDIKPLFDASCVGCHGAQKPKAGLRLDSVDAILKGGKEGKVVSAGDSAKSKLVIAVSRLDPESAMPPKQRQRRGPNGGNPPPNAAGVTNHPPADMTNPSAGAPAAGPQHAPPPKPLTPEQVGLVRAWIDQGAK